MIVHPFCLTFFLYVSLTTMSELLSLIKSNSDWLNILKNPPYCLRISREGDLACFTYGPRSSQDEPINKVARGIIIDVVNFKIVCYPLDRFYNYGEMDISVQNLDWESTIATEKMDGSIIKLYYYNGSWKIATRGYAHASPQFMSMWERVTMNGVLDYSKLDVHHTYVFEIVGRSNRVVVEYDKDDLYHIATRDLVSLKEIVFDIGVQKPRTHPFTNIMDAKKLVSTFDPRKTEGLVLVDKHFNRLKVKSDQYIVLHNMLGINSKVPIDQTCVKLILTGEAGEFLVARPDMRNIVMSFEKKLEELVIKLEKIQKDLEKITDRKAFSQQVWKIRPPFPQLHFNLFDKKYASVKDWLYSCDDYKMIAGLTRLTDLTDLTDLTVSSQGKSTKFVSWVRMGSPDSTDDDIAVVVTDRNLPFDDSVLRKEIYHQSHSTSSPPLALASSSATSSSSETSSNHKNEHEHEQEHKELDINLITVGSNGDITWCQKGDMNETQNIIWHTYRYHKQCYECPVSSGIEIGGLNPEKKIKATSKYFLDNCAEICGQDFYLKHKKAKDAAYTGTTEQRVSFVNLMSTSFLPFGEIKSHLKAIVLKICQVILFEYGELEYNKLLIPEKMHLIHTEHCQDCEHWQTCQYCANIGWFLSRQKQSVSMFKEDTLSIEADAKGTDRIAFRILKMLVNQYCEIARSYTKTLEWSRIPLNIDAIPYPRNCLPRRFYELFLTSSNMLTPSDEILDLFAESVGNERSINKIFCNSSSNIELLDTEFVKNHVHAEAQRSDEWKNLLTFYQCGKNTGLQSCEFTNMRDYYRFYWNLIRGNIAEQIVLSSLNALNHTTNESSKTNYLIGEQVQVGLLVQEKKKQSLGIAPDLLIVKDSNNVLPVEIKSCQGRNNATFRRELSLAKRQLAKSRTILGNYAKESCIIMVYMEDNLIEIQSARYN